MLPSIIIYGLVNSVILALIAMGFSLTFGISGVANFAYGGFYLLSGFLVWIFLNYLKFPFVLAVVVTIGVMTASYYISGLFQQMWRELFGMISMIYEIRPVMGLEYTIIAIIVVVLGGLGSITGSLVGGFTPYLLKKIVTD